MIWSQCFDKARDKETGLDTNKIIISSIKSISRTKINIKENVEKKGAVDLPREFQLCLEKG